MNSHKVRRFFLVALLLTALALEWRTGSVSCRVARSNPAANAAGSPVACISNPAANAAGSPVVLADSWSFGNLLSGGGRTRIVQICVVCMCLALFIMMRKLNG